MTYYHNQGRVIAERFTLLYLYVESKKKKKKKSRMHAFLLSSGLRQLVCTESLILTIRSCAWQLPCSGFLPPSLMRIHDIHGHLPVSIFTIL